MKFVLLAADSGEADLAFYYSVVKKWVNRGHGVACEGRLGYMNVCKLISGLVGIAE